MQTRQRNTFTTIRTWGAILPPDLLVRVSEGDASLDGLLPSDYHLLGNEKLNEAINRSWNRLIGAWENFQLAQEKVLDDLPGTTETRERWLLPLFQELGYGRLQTSTAFTLNGKSYPISHGWGRAPIHLLGFNIELDKRTPGVAGAATTSPYSMLQEFLNRSDNHLWAFLSNGIQLRILRDNASLTRQAYVEFDLGAMMEGEVYADFVLLWLLCHQSRVEGEKPEEFWLEKWSREAHEQGTRALDQLRDGVEQAISQLGSGFLKHPANQALRAKLRDGSLNTQDYYRQLLRLVYRLIFLFVAEDRDLLFPPGSNLTAQKRYTEYYSTQRLRRLAERSRGSRHADLYHTLRLVREKLGELEGCEELALPALGGFLFSSEATADLNKTELPNQYLLDAVRALAYTVDNRTLRPVDYKNLGPEELGSVYESLLELHPEMNVEAGSFNLTSASGHERKTTGSYYTPSSLIQVLLDSALDPVIEDRLEAVEGKSTEIQEQVLLNTKVCDPASGSGHFLIAAAHRLAKRLAAIRTGTDEPAPETTRTALRDVIGHCIYGVDVNPMAVELCKVSLWMEALEPGKPLSFLDHHIKCGNSLLGSTPALISDGIPRGAFKSIEGDDKKISRLIDKQNDDERDEYKNGAASQLTLFDRTFYKTNKSIAREINRINTIPDKRSKSVKAKQDAYQRLWMSEEYSDIWFIADAWCASLVWPKQLDTPLPITDNLFRRLQHGIANISDETIETIKNLSDQYNFFHWNLAFPDVFQLPDEEVSPENSHTGWNGGFDCVLGNPPWKKPKPEPARFFAGIRPDIANANTYAKRNKLLKKLNAEDPILFNRWHHHQRSVNGTVAFIKNSGLYKLTSFGKFNLGNNFLEICRHLLSPRGRLGIINISGFATDESGKFFFADLMDKGALISLYDFENRKGLFPNIHRSYRFSLVTIGGLTIFVEEADFFFFAQDTSDLDDTVRHITFTKDDINLLNPSSRNCSIFRTNRDATIVKHIYRKANLRSPVKEVLFRWDAEPTFMFFISIHSHLFHFQEELGITNPNYESIVYKDGEHTYLPLYEAKMFHQFEHRWASVSSEDGQINLDKNYRINPENISVPRYWMLESEANEKLENIPHNWLLAIRAITNTTNERTSIAAILPKYPLGHSAQAFRFEENAPDVCAFLACLNSFVFDFAARTKIGGSNLSRQILVQLPILPNYTFKQNRTILYSFVVPRVLELTYTAWDLKPFAKDLNYHGPPFIWNEERRYAMSCELDAMYFHLYSIAREDVNYIMDTFPIVRRKDEKLFGEYRTKRVILDFYDQMRIANETGNKYQSLIDPPPAHPSVTHPNRDGSVYEGPSLVIDIDPFAVEQSHQAVKEGTIKSKRALAMELNDEKPITNEEPTETSDYALYKCRGCSQMVMGFDKKNHTRLMHGGEDPEYVKL